MANFAKKPLWWLKTRRKALMYDVDQIERYERNFPVKASHSEYFALLSLIQCLDREILKREQSPVTR